MGPSLAPVVIITGANGGVGYGSCQRLLEQMCLANPPDAFPRLPGAEGKPEDFTPTKYSGLTLIMACRSVKRGEAARTLLSDWFAGHVDDLLKEKKGIDEDHLRTFKDNCNILVEELDLASFSSALKFAERVKSRVPYVSHLLFNAGAASFDRLVWGKLIKQILQEPMMALTAPKFNAQFSGELSADNLGWVWQANVFGHFVVFRELEAALAKSPFGGARVIWVSSIESSPIYYDSKDWQLKDTHYSYQSSKYQIDLIAANLDIAARESGSPRPTRHFVTEPGVCSTKIGGALKNSFLDILEVVLFFFARILGSPYHNIEAYNGASAGIHLILAPLAFIPLWMSSGNSKSPARVGSRVTPWGKPYVALTDVADWEKNKEEGKELIKRCDALYEKMKRDEMTSVDPETASEAM